MPLDGVNRVTVKTDKKPRYFYGWNIGFDILGSYRLAFIVVAGLFGVAAFLIGMARPTEAHRYATADEMPHAS